MHRVVLLALSIVVVACATREGGATATTGAASSGAEPSGVRSRGGDVVGPTSREEIESSLPAWREAAASADVEHETARALASVPPGAEVVVYLGTWCGDSRREVARLFRALELAPDPRPFTLALIGVDRAKTAPGYTEGVDLRYVPTIVVRREGREVGRIVESAPRGIERELLDLLTGARQGVITGRTDL